MKKLNRKGFTLVELLAVIVILAIVVGITMVTILPTLESSRKKAFDTAVGSITEYIQKQKEMSLLSSDLRNDGYNEEVGKASSGTGATGKLLEVTGYSKNITAIQWKYENGVAKITCATANPDGDYRQSENYTVCGTGSSSSSSGD